jgi:hypothetical protein
MRWSFYKAKTFNRCQRKWYYSEIEANHSKKNADRREIYLLKQLQSVAAWRGSIVDTVIDQKIIPGIIYDNLPTDQELIDYAFDLVDTQLEFAREERHKDPEMTKTSAGEKYCALYDIEYNDGVKQDELDDAKADIESAIWNLLNSDLLQELRAEKPHMITQRPLTCDFMDSSIACVPDLLVFYENKPPKIVDWKVHRHGNTIFKQQLALYALVLTKIDPHQDFPDYANNWLQDPTEFSLLEYQLLLNTCREYSITSDDVVEMENYIYSSINQMQKLVRDRDHSEIDIDEFQTAISPGICDGCEFKEPCWEGMYA